MKNIILSLTILCTFQVQASCADRMLHLVHQLKLVSEGIYQRNLVEDGIEGIAPARRVLLRTAAILKSNEAYRPLIKDLTLMDSSLIDIPAEQITHKKDFALLTDSLKKVLNYSDPYQLRDDWFPVEPARITNDPWLELHKDLMKSYYEYFSRYVKQKDMETVWGQILKKKENLNFGEISKTLELINGNPTFCRDQKIPLLNIQELSREVLRTYFTRKVWALP